MATLPAKGRQATSPWLIDKLAEEHESDVCVWGGRGVGGIASHPSARGVRPSQSSVRVRSRRPGLTPRGSGPLPFPHSLAPTTPGS